MQRHAHPRLLLLLDGAEGNGVDDIARDVDVTGGETEEETSATAISHGCLRDCNGAPGVLRL